MPRRKVPIVPSEELPSVRCGECWYFETENIDTGYCHVLPPSMVTNHEGQDGFARPQVDPHDKGCMYFKPRHVA